ncbi:Transposase-like protein [Thioalkalivibrio nitratireducens DSM 14787]|uniref:Transposase-like protein n=1 Tax=Thioalkalivibrio nitratireducens (strain DSM 14787 / UNIQEM 213 / ALEN2) TaxID=1255043 RepID=L0DWG2_THIND|nr:transposase [Thioalkalivibrio nitratireducens]AGA33924.1 Transposase-like protein [Thioalkalivibrio nitratireducens DSM 14787]
MPQPRSSLVSLSDTPWYHVVSRCVRRAYLCGEDAHSGRSFEHRRGWIVERLEQLAGVFAVDVAAYAVMSNHAHLVVRIDAERVQGWDAEEVLRRWTQVFSGPLLVQRYLADPASLGEAETAAVFDWVETYRSRLADLSWYMRVLNESIARMANAEDGVTGRFWEGRFKSQALLDDAAVLTAMAYVDLNPIRAKLAETPETSEYTAIAERLAELQGRLPRPHVAGSASPSGADRTGEADETAKSPESPDLGNERPRLQKEPRLAGLPCAPLMPFDATGRLATAVPFALEDYLELVDGTGRVIREDKRGFIPGETPAILERLNIDPEQFIQTAGRTLHRFGSAIGTPERLTERCVARNVAYLRGIRAARVLFDRCASRFPE